MNWYAILTHCGVRPPTAAVWATIFEDTVKADTFSAGVKDIPDFLGQILHETQNLERMQERLDYSAERLMGVWPSRFPTLEAALPYAYQPQKLANKVYGGRMGNVGPDDGWRYRGRAMGITGLANYRLVGDLMGQDLVDLPELLEQPHYALEAMIAWWENKIPDSALGDTLEISHIVNGGEIGLASRERLTALALEAVNGEFNTA